MRGGDGEVNEIMDNYERYVDLIINLVMTELLEINLISCFR